MSISVSDLEMEKELVRHKMKDLAKQFKRQLGSLEEELHAIEVLIDKRSPMKKNAVYYSPSESPSPSPSQSDQLPVVDACYEVVEESEDDKILRPGEVEKILINQGFIFNTKQPSATISPALSKLADDGKIIQVKFGKKNRYKKIKRVPPDGFLD